MLRLVAGGGDDGGSPPPDTACHETRVGGTGLVWVCIQPRLTYPPPKQHHPRRHRHVFVTEAEARRRGYSP